MLSIKSPAMRPASRGLAFRRCGFGSRPCNIGARRSHVAYAGRSPEDPHIQLGTAVLPKDIDVPTFVSSTYNWAATLTQSGANYPFALVLKTDKLPNGFMISLLRRGSSAFFDSAGDIQATVEPVDGKGNVFFIRFYEGPAAFNDRRTPPPTDTKQRLEVALDALVDVPIIMQTMPRAIRAAVQAAKSG